MLFDFYNQREIEAIQRAFEGKTIGLTSGTFDLNHSMHEYTLESFKRLCGINGVLIVGVDSDYLVRERKGPPRPIIAEFDRLLLVGCKASVDAAFILGSVEDFGRAAELLRVQYIFRNQDFQNEHVLGSDLPGVELIIVPDFHRTESTTELISHVVSQYTSSKEGDSHE